MGGGGRAGWRSVLGALCLGHLAAACSFSSSNMVGMMVLDPSVRAMSPYAFVTEFAVVALGFPPFMLVILLPFSVLTSPFTIVAALWFRANAATALAAGAAIGAAWAFLFAWSAMTEPLTWSRGGVPGELASLTLICVDGAAAGMAYAWVVWSRCIRPYVDRSGPLRAVQVSP